MNQDKNEFNLDPIGLGYPLLLIKPKNKKTAETEIKKKFILLPFFNGHKPIIKKMVGKLRRGSKTHAKKADDIEKAMKALHSAYKLDQN